MSVEFPNDNPDLWELRAPLAALAVLLAEAEVAAEKVDRSDPNDPSDCAPVEAALAPAILKLEIDRSDPNDLPDSTTVEAGPEIDQPTAPLPPAVLAEIEMDRSDPNDPAVSEPMPAVAGPEPVMAAEITVDRSDPNDLLVSEPAVAGPEAQSDPEPVMASEITADRSEPNDLPVSEPMATIAEDDGPEVEVIEFDDADFAAVENESIPPPPRPDLFQVYVRTLVEVALAAGAPGRVVEVLPGMLGLARLDARALDEGSIDSLVAAGLLARSESGAVIRSDSFVATAQAWRATLLGEEADFSACSSALDEWSANLIASLAGTPHQRETLRRDLRSRGVAAFGLLIEAA